MRITLFTTAARGDTQPFLALAVRLMQAGHEVKLAARPDFSTLAAEYKVDFAPLGHAYEPFITGAAEASAIGSGHLLKQLRYGLRQGRYVSDQHNEDAWRAAQGAEAIIYKYTWVSGYSIAEKLGLPCAAAMLFPVTPTRAFPSFMFGRAVDRGPILNRLVWKATGQFGWQLQRRDDNQLRRRVLKIPTAPFLGPELRQQRQSMPVFYPYSPAVLPRPVDWPDRMHVTGYWFLDPPPRWEPPADLVRFLEAGAPPVSIGFGSMASADPTGLLNLVLRALELAGVRGILLSGWAGIGRGRALPANVYWAESLPHSWLFPRVAAVVQHGGAGTTGAALRAGVPSIITPLAADQHSWARRIHELGASPAPIPFQSLTAERLAGAVGEALNDEAMHKHALELSRLIQAEDGPGRTIELFMDHIDRFRRARKTQPASGD